MSSYGRRKAFKSKSKLPKSAMRKNTEFELSFLLKRGINLNLLIVVNMHFAMLGKQSPRVGSSLHGFDCRPEFNCVCGDQT